MSSTYPSSLALTGGIPTKSQDLAASVVFCIVYALLFPVACWRLATKASRCWSLLRLFVFILLRFITYIFRALQANGNYAKSLFIGEQILLLCGFILLCEPLLTLLAYHMMRNVTPNPSRGSFLVHVQRLLKLALVAAVILGIYAGSQYGGLDKPSSLSKVKTCRDVNAIICVVVTFLAGVVAITAQFRETSPASLTVRFTGFIVVASGLLLIPSVYRIVLYTGSVPGSEHVGTKVAFYLLFCLPEVLVTALYLLTNLNESFKIPAGREKEKAQKEMKTGTFRRTWSLGGRETEMTEV